MEGAQVRESGCEGGGNHRCEAPSGGRRAPGFKGVGFGFRVSGFGFRVSGFGF